jgi:hypothetical protein
MYAAYFIILVVSFVRPTVSMKTKGEEKGGK